MRLKTPSTGTVESAASGLDKGEPKTPRDARNAAAAKRSEKLHRRTISDTLKAEKKWEVHSYVDGYVDFALPPRMAVGSFAEEVRQAVQALGYEPTVRIRRGSGRVVIRVYTKETLAQAPRGAHGFGKQSRREL